MSEKVQPTTTTA